MKRSKPTKGFWAVLNMVNLLGLLYPIHLLLRANSVDETLFATCVLVGSLFLLVVGDAASISSGCSRRWETWRRLVSPSANNYLPVEPVCHKRIDLADMSEKIRHRDALYLFACQLEWHTKRNLAAYHELIAALDDQDGDTRHLAESLLQQSSPRPERTAAFVESW